MEHDGTVNEPWMYPDVLPVREAIRCYRLLPISTHCCSSQPKPDAIIARWYTTSRTLSAGPNRSTSCSAPICWSPGAEPSAAQQVYLPSGTAWCDFVGEWHAGRQAVAAPLERYPLFARWRPDPDGKVMQHVGAQRTTCGVYAFPILPAARGVSC